jgi:uncharacterized phage protein (TIGR02220 family)
MNSYELSRNWFDWCFENPEKINPNHSALYFFCIEHCNRLGWKPKFGLPTTMAKEAIGIKSYNTYSNTLTNLVEWGFIEMLEKSKNQYSANIIALSNNDKALNKALDKALIKHATKQSESTSESISSIDKQITINKEQETIDYDKLLKYINLTFDKKFQKVNDKAKKQFNARLKDYPKDTFKIVIDNLKNDEYHKETSYKFITPEYISREKTVELHSHKLNNEVIQDDYYLNIMKKLNQQ